MQQVFYKCSSWTFHKGSLALGRQTLALDLVLCAWITCPYDPQGTQGQGPESRLCPLLPSHSFIHSSKPCFVLALSQGLWAQTTNTWAQDKMTGTQGNPRRPRCRRDLCSQPVTHSREHPTQPLTPQPPGKGSGEVTMNLTWKANQTTLKWNMERVGQERECMLAAV
jgi:hypothetical protein